MFIVYVDGNKRGRLAERDLDVGAKQKESRADQAVVTAATGPEGVL